MPKRMNFAKLQAHPERYAITVFVEELCELTTGESREVQANIYALSQVTGIKTSSIKILMYQPERCMGVETVLRFLRGVLSVGLTSELRLRVQHLKWKVLRSYALSGVSNHQQDAYFDTQVGQAIKGAKTRRKKHIAIQGTIIEKRPEQVLLDSEFPDNAVVTTRRTSNGLRVIVSVPPN